MRVLIDAIPLLLRSAGVKTYVYNWTRSLRALAGEHTVDLFPWFDIPETCDHERSALGRGPTLARLALLHAANYLPAPVLWPFGAGVDVFHASHQLLYPPRNTRVTATLYDMTCWLAPETHAADNVAKSKAFGAKVLTRAEGMIAISESTRLDAIRILGLRPERIEVIYPGVAEAFFGARPAVSAMKSGEKPYILFVGTIEPRKNVGALLDAYGQLRKSLREEFDLAIAGPAGWGDPSVIYRLRLGSPGVRYLGYVAEQDLPGLTAGATVFVYPSLYEGFGLPVAQAMAAGVPIITSNVSSLPEVGGEAAMLIDPRSTVDLAAALDRVLLSPDLRKTMSAKGIDRAEQYHWGACAAKSWRFFERLG